MIKEICLTYVMKVTKIIMKLILKQIEHIHRNSKLVIFCDPAKLSKGLNIRSGQGLSKIDDQIDSQASKNSRKYFFLKKIVNSYLLSCQENLKISVEL